MPWLAFTLELDAASAEALSEALLEAGAESTWLDDAGGDWARQRLSALVPPSTDVATLLGRAARAAGLKQTPPYSLSQLEDDDWVRRTQAQFGPLAVGTRLWIVPSWHEPPVGAQAVVRLDPGLAFGTGSHPSTRLVLAFLERVLAGGERVLDYGCGSGILAIAAARLGAAQVDAVDLDAEALAATAANARANQVAVRALAADDLPDPSPANAYDVVVANILAQPLIMLAPLLAAHTRRGGRIALSGILERQAKEVATRYAPWFDLRPGALEEGWALVEGVRR